VLKSAPGQGTTFVLMLPMAVDAGQQ
jgi:hypothetical protein